MPSNRKIRKSRSNPVKTVSSNIFVCVEGGRNNKTERKYLNQFDSNIQRRIKLEISKTDVTSLNRLYQCGLSWLRKANQGLSNKEQLLNQVFIVYDLDFKSSDWRTKTDFAIKHTTNQIHFLPTNPSFEYWLLLHFKKCNPMFGSYSALESELQKYISNYSKDFHYTFSDDEIEKAIQRAEELICSGNDKSEIDLLKETANGTSSLVYILIKKLLY